MFGMSVSVCESMCEWVGEVDRTGWWRGLA